MNQYDWPATPQRHDLAISSGLKWLDTALRPPDFHAEGHNSINILIYLVQDWRSQLMAMAWTTLPALTS